MHRNNFGFLRLLFATLVIVSHSAEIIDGNRSRELLTSIAGILTFGEVAVDAFFIISGYLVLKSFENSRSIFAYLTKRVRRIYPGFLVAFFICLFLFGPFVGSNFPYDKFSAYLRSALAAITLGDFGASAFPGLTAHSLNGSMWTITYEFKCYLYIIAFGWMGLYRRRVLFALFTAALLISNEIHWPTYIGPLAKIVGYPPQFIRLEAMFCAGGCFYLFRDRIFYRHSFAVAAAVVLACAIYTSFLAEAAIAVIGGYLIFWCALHLKSEILQHINSSDDISYGVYLYAWPIQCSLVYFFHIGSPWLLTTLTITLAYAAGFTSWRTIERRFVHRSVAARLEAPPA